MEIDTDQVLVYTLNISCGPPSMADPVHRGLGKTGDFLMNLVSFM